MLAAAGVNVMLTTKGIDDMAMKYCINHKILCVRRVTRADIKAVGKATGGTYVCVCLCYVLLLLFDLYVCFSSNNSNSSTYQCNTHTHAHTHTHIHTSHHTHMQTHTHTHYRSSFECMVFTFVCPSVQQCVLLVCVLCVRFLVVFLVVFVVKPVTH